VLVSGSANACKWLVPSAGNGGFSLTAGSGAQQWTNLADPPNIANWTSSVTGLGYERDPGSGTSYASLIGAGSNTETQMYAINGTAYMRVNFTVADAAALANIGSLKLSLKYDDGFRAYLNGVLVAGRNDTDPSLASNPATAVANQIHDDPLALVYEDIDITADGLAALRVGTNVLAFHVMNSPATSSDLLLVPRLTAGAAGAGGGSGGIAYTGPIMLSSSRTINARLFANGVWSPMTTAQFIVGAAPATASNLVISEIMYNPRGASSAESLAGFGDNDFEYVEILNVGPGAVDLTPCKFTLGITFDFSVADPDLRTLPAGGRIIVVGHRDGFALRYGNNPQIRIAGVFAGSLANEGETLVLRGAGDAIIAQVTYGISEPWPVASAGEGYSLLLNNPTGSPAYGDGMNWRSSGQIDGNPGLAPGPGFVGSPTVDTDKDGLTDFIEFAMGTDKTKGDSNQQIEGGFLTYEVEGNPGDYLHIRFPRNLAADGVNYIAECSSDLINWNLPLTYVGTTHNGDGRAMVEYRTTDPIDAPTNRRLGLRLRVVAP
jgi:hypothetical protein